jgi:hypothetical protein
MLERIIENNNTRNEIKNAARMARLKILDYYPSLATDGKIYIIATG